MKQNCRKAICLASAAAAGLGAAAVSAIYGYVFYSPRGNQNDDYHLFVSFRSEEERVRSLNMIAAMKARPFEPVSTLSQDGLRLAGRYYHAAEGAPLAILCHGYRGTPSRDFSGGAGLCMDLGYNVLLIEERAHCSSEGRSITFGIKERYDVLAWINYAVERFGGETEILLVGISMGAATVLMASELPLPENVRGILADCPYTSPEEIIRKVGREAGFSMNWLFPLVRLAARGLGSFSISESSAISAVRHTPVPILLIHGEADDFVPCDMSRAIAAANPDKIELHTFPGAGHGLSYLADTPRYRRLVTDFCRKVLAAPGGSRA